MLDALTLRTQVEALLTGLLGTYRLPNGSIVVALSVIKSYDIYPPEGTKITGIEAVIVYPSPIVQMIFDAYQVEREWTIYLKQWDRNGHLQQAIEQILKLDNIKRIASIPPNELLGIPDTATVLISDWVLMGGAL